MPDPEFVLKRNAKGAEVKQIQEGLTKLGFKISDTELAGSVFGADTERAVTQLQMNAPHLEPTGVIDAATLQAIDHAQMGTNLINQINVHPIDLNLAAAAQIAPIDLTNAVAAKVGNIDLSA